MYVKWVQSFIAIYFLLFLDIISYNIGNIPYFTDHRFTEEYLKFPEKLELTELIIEEDYKSYLIDRCSKEKSKKNLEINAASKFNKKKLPAANAILTPSCDLYTEYFETD